MELEMNISENDIFLEKKSDFFSQKNEILENGKKPTFENLEKQVKNGKKNEENDKSVENVDIIVKILKICGFVLNNLTDLNNLLIPRDLLMNMENYKKVKEYFEKLKKTQNFSSSNLTCLHKDADKKQKWPLLNLVRQILKVKYYMMTPYRKSNGKDASGKKRYVRYFLIEKMNETVKKFQHE
jgi:hypothetical protein